MRTWLLIVLAALSVAGLRGHGLWTKVAVHQDGELAPVAAPVRAPDVLLISLDTLRADALSCYGNERRTSPNLDALAARGVRFQNCYATAPHMAPSHISLFSGLTPIAHGVPNASAESKRLPALNDAWPTLTTLMADAGYQTTFVANQGQLRRAMGLGRGVEQFDTSTNTFGAAITVLESMLDDVDPDAPLFSFVHTYEPHAPYLPPREIQGRPFHGHFTDLEYRGPVFERYEALLPEARRGTELAQQFLEGAEAFEPKDVEFLVGLYLEDVLWTDFQLGRLLAIWGRHRDLSNTLVVIVSDHGEQLGERGRFGHRYGLDLELLHVPFIAAGPGITTHVDESTVSLAGVAASVLGHLGLAVPPHMEPGPVLAAAVLESVPAVPHPAHAQDPIGKHASLGLVDGRHLYMRGVAGNPIGERVYDLGADPAGLTAIDVGEERLAQLRQLSKARQLSDFVAREKRPPRTDDAPSEDQRALLRALGYDASSEPSKEDEAEKKE